MDGLDWYMIIVILAVLAVSAHYWRVFSGKLFQSIGSVK